jgi:Ser/Thr protein kinase RdoA (MazF antagonist)
LSDASNKRCPELLEDVETSVLAETFFSLTPERILESVERQGLGTTGRCIALNSLENRVYDVELDGEEAMRVVMKFYRPGRWSREAILEEHQFLTELAGEGIPVVPPMDLGGGGTLGEIEGIFYAGFPRRRGRPPDELSDEVLRRLGRFVAAIHNVGARADAKHRLRVDPDRMLVAASNELASRNLMPPTVQERYLSAALRIAELVRPAFREAACIRLHGDLHLGNLLMAVDDVGFVDFDDMMVGPPVQDLWLLTPGRDDHTERQRDVFLEGYTELREFDRKTLSLIEALRAMRVVHYSAWIARRWNDPGFPRVFPAFLSERYWVEELRVLEEQVEYVEAGPEGPARERVPDLGGAGGEDDPAWNL